MPNAPAADAAVAFARASPNVSFGVHLTFVGDGTRAARRPGVRGPGSRRRRGKAAADEPNQAARSARPPVRDADRARGHCSGRLAACPRSRGLARRLAPTPAQVPAVPRSARESTADPRHLTRSQRPGRLPPPAARQPDSRARPTVAGSPDVAVHDDGPLLHADVGGRRRMDCVARKATRGLDARDRCASRASSRTGGGPSRRDSPSSLPLLVKRGINWCVGPRSSPADAVAAARSEDLEGHVLRPISDRTQSEDDEERERDLKERQCVVGGHAHGEGRRRCGASRE